MNKKIKELMEQAFETADYPEGQEYRIEPNEAFCKKFAELIVDEFANQIKSQKNKIIANTEFKHGYTTACDDVASIIKKIAID